MSKIKSLMLLVLLTCLSPSALAITNAELARLNNELIGLGAQLAVAKKRSELEKYKTSVAPGNASAPEIQSDAQTIAPRKLKQGAADNAPSMRHRDTVNHPGDKPIRQ